MGKQGRFSLQEYGERSVLTTWTISYDQVMHQSEDATNLLKLWGFLDPGDLWYELIACALRLGLDVEIPLWIQRVAEDKLEFLETLQLLTRYSLVDARLDTSSHSLHAVLHEWCRQLVQGDEARTLSLLAIGLVAKMVPSQSEDGYWKVCKRLLPHSIRICRSTDDKYLEW
jgi:hypothetical protein